MQRKFDVNFNFLPEMQSLSQFSCILCAIQLSFQEFNNNVCEIEKKSLIVRLNELALTMSIYWK